MTTEIQPVPEAVLAAQFPTNADRQAGEWNQKAKAWADSENAMVNRTREIALNAHNNAVAAEERAEAADLSAISASNSAGDASSYATAAANSALSAAADALKTAADRAAIEDALVDGPVITVNGRSGIVELDAQDVGAIPETGGVATGLKYTVADLEDIEGAIELDFSVAQEFVATVTDDVEFTIANAPASGETQTVYLRLTDAGSFALDWPANTRFDSSEPLALTAGGEDLLAVKYDSGVLTVYVIGLNVGAPA